MVSGLNSMGKQGSDIYNLLMDAKNCKIIALGTPSELINNSKAKSHYFGDSFKFN